MIHAFLLLDECAAAFFCVPISVTLACSIANRTNHDLQTAVLVSPLLCTSLLSEPSLLCHLLQVTGLEGLQQ